MDDYGDVYDKTQILSQMRCETTSPGVQECALCASSVYHVHHASICVNVVIGVLVVQGFAIPVSVTLVNKMMFFSFFGNPPLG